jgi:lipopolysaccharide/colanic/teichoic acid biosynthesis glycosyltransferase
MRDPGRGFVAASGATAEDRGARAHRAADAGLPASSDMPREITGAGEGWVPPRTRRSLPRPLGGVRVVIASLAGGGLALVLLAMTGIPGLGMLELAGATGALAVAMLVPSVYRRGKAAAIRVAVIGSAAATQELSDELAIVGVTQYTVVGRIDCDGGCYEPSVDPIVLPAADLDAPLRERPLELDLVLGSLDELDAVVEHHGIDLLVMTGEVSRLQVFNTVASSCLDLPVRLWELSAFYEEVFGHVPLAEINAAWFQYMMHPRYSAYGSAFKRTLDVSMSAGLLLVLAPVLAVLALVIRRNGSPLFKQVRIGEGGRPFTLYKLRTMRPEPEAPAQWASNGDPRVTRLGRLLRRTHLDELPQLANILKGDMSLVGPRPEQPEFVERLEAIVPFYHRRHLIKPGLTGWAQIHCGYGGSDIGSAWKVAHDLYYLKHRSLRLDLAILVATVRFLFDEAVIEGRMTSFVVSRNPGPVGVEAPAPAER